MSAHDDPRLTAYVLDELAPEERAAMEALIAEDPAARAEVEAIRETVALLEAELSTEAAGPTLDPAAREAVLAGPATPTRPKRRAWFWGAAATLSAAAALMLWIRVDEPMEWAAPAVEEPSRTEIAPSSTPSAAPATLGQEWDTPAESGKKPPESNPARRTEAHLHRFQADDSPALDGDELVVAPRLRASRRVDDPNAPRPTRGRAVRELGDAASEVVGRRGLIAGKGLIAAGPHKPEPQGGDRFDRFSENPFTRPTDEPLSTFSIDVDTASYSLVRSMLRRHRRPAPGAVRIEELINYFDYDYAPPKDGRPFATHVEIAAAPWAPRHRLVRVGLKGHMVPRPQANLVFLLDVSGSMSARNKLPLLKDALRALVHNLRPDDRVAIVVYAGAAGLVLPSTPAKDKRSILEALDRLQSGGGTNGGAGIEQAYWVAAQNFVRGGVNRVLIGTDGDFNVGTTSQSELVRLVEEKAQGGIALTVLGFGMGNYNDSTLEKLADKGDGNYAYIDTAEEARKVLVDQLEGTLVTIAKDVKIQVEFNPAQVSSYRLIGYENRRLAAQDFNDDTKDAGEIGAGHTVTALYEVVPAGVAPGHPTVDPLKYQARHPRPQSDEMLTLKLRYKAPDGGPSQLLTYPVIDAGRGFADASADLRFAASVAAFGMLLRGSPHVGEASFSQVEAWAERAVGRDAWGYRRGFMDLIRLAKHRP